MRTNKLLTLFILNLFLFSGCETNYNDFEENDLDDDFFQTDNILYSKDAKLKQVSIKGDIWYVRSEYEYDDSGRISRISCPMYANGKINGVMSYDNYFYNNENQLEKIMNFNANLTWGFINLHNEIYTYDNNGNKLKTAIEYPQIGQTDSIFYYYEKNRLIREDKFDGVSFKRRITVSFQYEYNDQGDVVKYTATNLGEDMTPTGSFTHINKHSYQNGLKVKSEFFNSNNEKAREIRFFYNKNNNLIYLKSQELLSYSSAMSYVSKYEYY